MCGIVGFWNPTGISSQVLEHLIPAQLVHSLAHRGPSSEHHKVFADTYGPKCMLGTARLAIVGINDGVQPVSSPCGRWWVSMNGEIYNHQELREQLLGAAKVASLLVKITNKIGLEASQSS